MSEFETFQLGNGIRVVCQHVKSPIAHACVLIDAGSRHEPETQFGMAHFIEHLLFKRTTRRSTSQIINWLESVGADLNAYTTKEYTCLHASFLKPYLGRTLDLFEDLLFHSEFPQEEIKKEKGIILDEIASYRDSPEDAVLDDFEDMVFQGHGLGHNILGLEEDLLHMDKAKVKSFMLQQYNTSGIVIGISGDFTPKEVERKVEKYFGQLPSSEKSKMMTNQLLLSSPISLERRLPINQVHYVMGRSAYSIYEDKRVGLLVLNNILGGMGMGSRLNMTVREKHGIAYTIESSYQPFSDTGLFSVYFGTDEDKYLKAHQLILKEFKKVRTRKLSDLQLHQAKRKFKGQIALGEESRMALIIGQSKSMLDHGYVQTLTDVFQKIDGVTTEQVLEIANEVLDPDQFFSLVFLPE